MLAAVGAHTRKPAKRCDLRSTLDVGDEWDYSCTIAGANVHGKENGSQQIINTASVTGKDDQRSPRRATTDEAHHKDLAPRPSRS